MDLYVFLGSLNGEKGPFIPTSGRILGNLHPNIRIQPGFTHHDPSGPPNNPQISCEVHDPPKVLGQQQGKLQAADSLPVLWHHRSMRWGMMGKNQQSALPKATKSFTYRVILTQLMLIMVICWVYPGMDDQVIPLNLHGGLLQPTSWPASHLSSAASHLHLDSVVVPGAEKGTWSGPE